MHGTKGATAIVLAALWFPALAGAEETPDPEKARQERLEFLTGLFGQFELTAAERGEPLSATDEPVLRYSNPVRNFFSDGAVFLWVDGRRPVAAAALSIRGTGRVVREFTSLSDQPLVCRRDGAVVWSPKSAGLLNQEMPDAPEPADAAQLRLVQMRRMAQRFTADVQPDTDPPTELRLLPQPLYRYAAAEHGVVDGALFALALTNDPDVLLRLELVRPASDAPPVWRYSLARLSAPPVTVRLDGSQIWSAPGYWRNPRTPNDPYIEAFEGQYPAAPQSAP